jgi:hemerythrin-like domain-containing protein
MPIQLGAAPEHGFDTPLGLLSDCHRRIERFLDQLLRVVEAQTGTPEAGMTPEQRIALTVALRYFREAAPMHTRDEEESLFPRLRASHAEAAQVLMNEVAALEADHKAADYLHAEVDRLGNRWLTLGTLSEVELARMWDLLAGLRETYRRHIAVEDSRVFPLAAQVLSAEEQQGIGQEMAGRRNLPFLSLAPRISAKKWQDRTISVKPMPGSKDTTSVTMPGGDA